MQNLPLFKVNKCMYGGIARSRKFCQECPSIFVGYSSMKSTIQLQHICPKRALSSVNTKCTRLLLCGAILIWQHGAHVPVLSSPVNDLQIWNWCEGRHNCILDLIHGDASNIFMQTLTPSTSNIGLYCLTNILKVTAPGSLMCCQWYISDNMHGGDITYKNRVNVKYLQPIEH